MSSDERLHPYSIIFAFLTQIRIFIVPGLFVWFGVGQADYWRPWMMLFVIPALGTAVVRYWTYRYRYEGAELVIRTGLLFRRERHIPYARIQNIDAVQNVLHRVLHVAEVRIDTGTGGEAEATMSVLPLSALHAMRERVFADRAVAALASDADKTAAADALPAAQHARKAGEPLLALRTRDLLLLGFIENRGAVLVAAGFGLVWELGIFDRVASPLVGDRPVGRGMVRDLVRGVVGNALVSFDRVIVTLAALAALLVFVRLVSMAWAFVRLHGFRLTLVNGDARSEFGLVTHVSATLPLRRVQALTVRESPMHRVFKRVSVHVDTAGGHRPEDGSGATQREHLAPILRRDALDGFVYHIVGSRIDPVAWHPPAPGAFAREVKGWLATWLVPCVLVAAWSGWLALLLAPLLAAAAVLGARQTVRHLGWAATDDTLLVKSGWLWRRIVMVRFARMQVVTRIEGPFDRRRRMASIHVDTAGASLGGAVHIPYLARDTADTLYTRLSREAAVTTLRW